MTDLVMRLSAKDDTGPGFRSAADNADKLDRKLVDVDGSMERLSRWGKAGALALGTGLVVAGAAAAKFGVDAAMAASDFSEVGAAIEQTFGKQSAADLQAWAKTASTTMGQSSTQALSAAKTFGIFGKAAGLSGTDLTGFSTDLTELATDLASFNNTDPAVAIDALGAALRGEAEPARQFGILLDDATLKARAMAMGISDGTEPLTQQQKILAAYQEILAQTSLQQGDFARTSGGMANQLRGTKAIWEEIKIAAGTGLLPIAEQYLPMVNEGLVGFKTWIEANMPAIQATLTGWADKVIELYPQVQDQLTEVAATVQANWPQIKQTAQDIGTALEKVAQFSQGVWDAFQSLPEPVRETLMLAAIAQKTGALSISFKAADIVKDLFKSSVPVMNVGVLNTGAGGAGALGALGTGSKIASLGVAGLAVGGGIAFKEVLDWSTEGLTRSTTAANVYTSALEGAGASATSAADASNGMGAASIAAGTSMSAASYMAQALAGTLSLTGANAGLSREEIDAMSSAAVAIPPGATAQQLGEAVRIAGEKAGASREEIDTMTLAAWSVPASANLPALAQAITNAGQQGGWTTEQTNIMSAAIAAVPPGASVAEAAALIQQAGAAAGLSDQQVQGLTEAILSTPTNHNTDVTTTAPAAAGEVRGLRAAINGLEGREVRVGVSFSGSASAGSGGAATHTSYTGGGLEAWVDGQASALAKALAPRLAATGAYTGPGGGVLGRPLSDYVVSSEFGPRGGAMHYGIDLAAPMGQGVFASAPGLITQSGWNGGYGNFIAMDHGMGMVTRYGHMSALIAGSGAVVGQGQLIGQVGSTGDSTGPHLHFETMVGGTFVNPRNLVALRHGGLVPTALSAGEYYVPKQKAKGSYRLLSAINAGILSGPGSGTSDSIRAYAQAGDFIVNAKAASRHRGILDALVRSPQRLAAGGTVGGQVAGTPIPGTATTVQLLIDGRALHESLVRYRREAGVA